MRGAPATAQELQEAFARSNFDLQGISLEQALLNDCLRAALELGVMIGRWSAREIERCGGEVHTRAQKAAAMYSSGIMALTTAPKWQRRAFDERRRAPNVLEFKRRAAGERIEIEEAHAEPLACDWHLPGSA